MTYEEKLRYLNSEMIFFKYELYNDIGEKEAVLKRVSREELLSLEGKEIIDYMDGVFIGYHPMLPRGTVFLNVRERSEYHLFNDSILLDMVNMAYDLEVLINRGSNLDKVLGDDI